MVKTRLMRYGVESLFGLVLFFSSTVVSAATLSAQLDRLTVQSGQSVTLSITAIDLDGEIDFSELAANFDILDTSRSRNVNIINGQVNSSLSWQLNLMPLQEGELTIPVFSLAGEQSEPLVLTVKKQQNSSGKQDLREFILELSIDNEAPFVQQQVILTARIYQARSIIEGSLTDPQADGIILQRLGNDKSYTSKKNQQEYTVIERRYALFAQESGPLSIQPIKLVATVKKKVNRANNGFFTPTQKIRLRSNSLTLQVKAKPEMSQSAWWLPAETVDLTSSWTTDIAQARVDEPITRNINLSVKGVHSTQLPPIDPPTLDSAKIYPDKPEISSQQLSNSLLSYRVDKWAVIPRKAGPLHLPEIKLEWFDTINGRIRHAILPSETIEVLPAISTAKSNQPLPVVQSPDVQTAQVTPPESEDNAINVVVESVPQSGPDHLAINNRWQWLSALAFIGWILTAFLWWFKASSQRSNAKMQAVSVGAVKTASLKAVELACQQGDVQAIRRALGDWSNQQWSDNPNLNLKEIPQKLGSEDPELLLFFSRLDAALYSSQAEKIQCNELTKRIKQAIKLYNQRIRDRAMSAESKHLLPQL